MRAELDEIRAAGLYKEERVIASPQGAHIQRRRRRGPQLLREQLPRAGGPPGADRGRARGARALGLRPVVRALHLRHAGHPQGARGAAEPRSSAPRTRSSTPPASTPTAASSRRCSARRTRSSPTRSTTPRSSTASASARRSATATRTATWTSSRSCLKQAPGARLRLIATDGVFSMDGYLAKLDAICDLAERYDAMVMVDDSHATGFVGDRRPRHAGALRRDRARRRHHRHARQGARRRVAAASRAGARRSSSCCASARARTCSRTRSPRRSSPPR